MYAIMNQFRCCWDPITKIKLHTLANLYFEAIIPLVFHEFVSLNGAKIILLMQENKQGCSYHKICQFHLNNTVRYITNCQNPRGTNTFSLTWDTRNCEKLAESRLLSLALFSLDVLRWNTTASTYCINQREQAYTSAYICTL